LERNPTEVLLLDDWMDERRAAEILWRGHYVHSKSWLVIAIRKWMDSISSDVTLSKDPLLKTYAKIGIITFTVQAIEDFACHAYAYLKALEEGVDRIYEHVRDFGHPRLVRQGKAGSVHIFFKAILQDQEEVCRLLGQGVGSSSTDHLRSIYEFYKKHYQLYLKFKHGQSLVVVEWNGKSAAYMIPSHIRRENGRVMLPKEGHLAILDEWILAEDIITRINGYYLLVHRRSAELFPGWKSEIADLWERITSKLSSGV